MDELRPDLVITQDLCEVCAVSSGDLATACPIGTEVFSMNPRSLADVVVLANSAAKTGAASYGNCPTRLPAARRPCRSKISAPDP